MENNFLDLVPRGLEIVSVVELHGHKVAQGFEMLHSPDVKINEAANAIFVVGGQQSLSPVRVHRVMDSVRRGLDPIKAAESVLSKKAPPGASLPSDRVRGVSSKEQAKLVETRTNEKAPGVKLRVMSDGSFVLKGRGGSFQGSKFKADDWDKLGWVVQGHSQANSGDQAGAVGGSKAEGSKAVSEGSSKDTDKDTSKDEGKDTSKKTRDPFPLPDDLEEEASKVSSPDKATALLSKIAKATGLSEEELYEARDNSLGLLSTFAVFGNPSLWSSKRSSDNDSKSKKGEGK